MRISHLVTVCVAFGLSASSFAVQSPSDSGKPSRSVRDNVLVSAVNPAIRIRIDQSFRYAGAQRFVLHEVADAEQHFFVDAQSAKTIRRLYWIQFEQYLPGRGGQYNYDKDEPLAAWSLTLRTHVRLFTEPPAVGSDRARMHQFLERAGYQMPHPSVRARLVYVPEKDRRQELMIVYLEPGSAEPTTAARRDLVQRALAGLELNLR